MGHGPRGKEGRKASLLRKFADALELPKDIVMDLPRVTMVGNVQLYIENHRGIIEYAFNKVRINTTRGELVIFGEKLQVGNINPDEIVVDGRIETVHLQDWGEE